MPYFLFTFAGMLPWNVFNQTISRAAPSLVANQALVSKVFFPRLLVPLSSTLSVLVDFAVSLTLGLALLLVYRVNPGWPVLLLPVWIALVLATATGIGLAAAAVQVKYRDVGYLLPWLLQLLLYASPIAFSLDAVQSLSPAARLFFEANPMTWYVEAFRWSFLGLPAPETWKIAGAVACSAVVLTAGLLVFQKHERELADVI